MLSAATSTLLLMCCYILAASSAPVDSDRDDGPIKQNQLQEQTDEQQLESLKSLPGNVAVVKSNTEYFTQINGKTQTRQMHEEKVEDLDSGRTIAKVAKEIVKTSNPDQGKPKTSTKTEVDIPSQGIHKVTLDKKAKFLHGNPMHENTDETSEDYFSPYDSIQYTPTDMAEYIRKTGDDEGVAMAVEELVKERLMSRNEAVMYLEDVKNELETPQDVSNQRKLGVSREDRPKHHTKDGQHKIKSKMFGGQAAYLKSKGTKYEHKPSHKQPRFRDDDDDDDDSEMQAFTSDDEDISRNQILNAEENDVDYNDLLERLRIADFLYKEYSLEEVIYQLAKEMFVQSIIKGNRDAEESLQRFSNFLQTETAEGRISKELEKKILDVVMAALMDAVGDQEQQELTGSLIRPGLGASHPPHSDKSKSLKKHKNLETKTTSRELKQLVKKSAKFNVSESSKPIEPNKENSTFGEPIKKT